MCNTDLDKATRLLDKAKGVDQILKDLASNEDVSSIIHSFSNQHYYQYRLVSSEIKQISREEL